MDNTTLIIIAVLLFLLMSNRCKENFYDYKDKAGKSTYGLSKKKKLDKDGNVIMKHMVTPEHCKKNKAPIEFKTYWHSDPKVDIDVQNMYAQQDEYDDYRQLYADRCETNQYYSSTPEHTRVI